MYEIIFASDQNSGIGYQGELPWPGMPADMEFFKKKTTGHIVIMGHKTWNSIPAKHKPLSDRINLVLSRTKLEDLDQDIKLLIDQKGVYWFNSILGILRWVDTYLKGEGKGKTPYVIGGWEVYKGFLDLQVVSKVWHSNIQENYATDTYFDMGYLDKFKLNNTGLASDWVLQPGSDTVPRITLNQYTYYNHEEHGYLNHLQKLLEGDWRENRTGVSTYSLFCPQPLRFDLRDNRFPLLTTKQGVLRQIFVELMFYLSGSADSSILERQGVKVWQGNTSREFLDSRGLKHYVPGDMGPSYSFNFRHYGAQYKGCKYDYTDQGFDQVQYVINQIKGDPNSRRIMINLWDPSKLDQMALPPCMYSYQFYVNNRYLSCHATLRSSDTFLGLPWNICTAALFTKLLAHVCDLNPGDLIMTTNDAHIYENHIDPIKEQLARDPYPFPLLLLKEGTTKDLYSIQFDNLELLAYKCHPKLAAPMAV